MTFSPSLIRIMTDIVNFKKNEIPGIEIYVNKKNIKEIYALIIGPKDTHYHNGLFIFKLDFPENYPTTNPRVKFLTVNSAVRFNPNLYENGKVCLSILGTWSGPGWSSVMTLSSVLLSIQSLLHENPVINEPGYQTYKINSEIAQNYNKYLKYWTIKLGIIDIINNKTFTEYYNMFSDFIDAHLIQNIDTIINDTKTYSLLYNNDTLKGNNIYFIKNKKHKLDFESLIPDLNKINKN